MHQLKKARRSIVTLCLLVVGVVSVGSMLVRPDVLRAKPDSPTTLSQGGQSAVMPAFQELLDLSYKEKKGLTFYIKGQTVAGIVTKFFGSDAIEVRNQTHSRIVIRIESIDAMAMN
jgi:hypothetical protein